MDNFERPIYLQQLKESKNNGKIKVLTGIRQCGKTFILDKYFELLKADYDKEHILEYKLASNSNESFRNVRDFEKELRSKIDVLNDCYIYIDEVQMCAGFEEMLLSILADFPKVDFYITGSNSKMLSNDIIKKLGTNSFEVKVFPLSLEEFKKFYERIGNEDKIVDWLVEYFNVGGMPSVVINHNNKNGVFNTIKETILVNDIINRYDEVDRSILNRIICYISKTYGCDFSITNVTNEIKKNNKEIDENKIQKYFDYLEYAYMIYPLSFITLGKETLYNKGINKYYVIDHALANYISKANINRGYMIENIVLIELLRKGINNICIGKKNSEEKEIDFTFMYNLNRYFIQVTDEVPQGSSTEKREFDSFIDKNGIKILITCKEYIGTYGNNFPEVKVIKLVDFLDGYKL